MASAAYERMFLLAHGSPSPNPGLRIRDGFRRHVYVYAICKNEAHNVERFMSWASESDGVYCLDTGSTDGTQDLLDQQGVVVAACSVNPWRFDEAKNRALALVPDSADICICFNLDEAMFPAAGWRQQLETLWGPWVSQGRYKYVSSCKPDGSPDAAFWFTAIHASRGYIWRYPTHELLHGIPGKHGETIATSLECRHARPHWKPKSDDLALLQLALEEEPDDKRCLHYYGRELLHHHRWQEAMIPLQKHLQVSHWGKEKAASANMLAVCAERLERPWEAEKYYLRAVSEAPEIREHWGYLSTAHGMTLEPRKTRIVGVDEFLSHSIWRVPEETVRLGAAEERLNQFVSQSAHPLQYGWLISPLPRPLPMSVHARMQELPEFQTAGTAYLTCFQRAVEANPPDLRTARRIMRKAARYGISTLLPSVLAHFDKLSPVIREAATYLRGTLDRESVRTHAREIRNAWENRLHSTTYINDWWCHVLTSPCFNEIDLPGSYDEVIDSRSQALIALRKNDVGWVRRNAAYLDAFDLWARRAVLYACSVLLPQERVAVAGSIRHGIAEHAVAQHIEPGVHGAASPNDVWAKVRGTDGYSSGDMYTTGSSGGDSGGQHGTGSTGGPPTPTADIYSNRIKAPDNYPAYGTKTVQPSPRWLMERIPESDALLNEHGSKIMVSFQDSVDSGNCMDGTETYRRELMARLNLPPHTLEVAASSLLAVRDDPLTRRAARSAALRCASRHNLRSSADAGIHAGAGISGGHGDEVGAPDNYPSYGNKAVRPSPRWLMERTPESDSILDENGA